MRPDARLEQGAARPAGLEKPAVVDADEAGGSGPAVGVLTKGLLAEDTQHRRARHLDDIVESEHGELERRAIAERVAPEGPTRRSTGCGGRQRWLGRSAWAQTARTASWVILRSEERPLRSLIDPPPLPCSAPSQPDGGCNQAPAGWAASTMRREARPTS